MVVRGYSLVAMRALLIVAVCLVAEPGLQMQGLEYLWHMGLAAPQIVRSSWTKDQTCVLYIGR